MNRITLPATVEGLDVILQFIQNILAGYPCSPCAWAEIAVMAEEVFVNIVHYAYTPSVGDATVCGEVTGDPPVLMLQFIDNGKPYNPFLRADPDITLPTEARSIGGFGIYMVKNTMDHVAYAYVNGQNVLTVHKKVSAQL